MKLLFSPFESYFDAAGKPTTQGQHLLAAIARGLTEAEDAAQIVDGNDIEGEGALLFIDLEAF